MGDPVNLLSTEERLDELYWVLDHHVGHLASMANEMDRLSLPQVATDFRVAADGWLRVLQDIEDLRWSGAGEIDRVVRSPDMSPRRPSAPEPKVLHTARRHRQAAQDPGRSF